MFEISWSEILVVGIVALIVVGPKELPTLLRTVGKYMGIVKKQAAEFRAQFDEAMRETEFEQLRKDMNSIKTDAEASLNEVKQSVQGQLDDAKREFDAATRMDEAPVVAGPDAHDANGLPFPTEIASGGTAGSAAIAAAAAAAEPVPVPSITHAPAPEPVKAGA